jgi:hypothetical protein
MDERTARPLDGAGGTRYSARPRPDEHEDWSNLLTRTRSLFAASLIALSAPLAIAGCGGDDESSDEDPQEVVEATLNNDETITSGVLNLSVEGSAGDQGSFELSLDGPFQGVEGEPTALPQLDLTASASGEGAGQSMEFEGGLVVTEDNAFVEYGGEAYEVGTQTFSTFKDSFEQAAAQGASGSEGEDASASFQEGCEQAIEAQGGDPAACDFDVTAWFTDLSNEGTEDVEGAEAVHVSGNVDVPQMLDDIVQLSQSIPNSAPVEQAQLDQVEQAISEASFDLYSGVDDDLLRKLDLNLSIDASALESATPVPVETIDFGMSFGVGEVNEEQTIEAPSDAQPIDELLGQFGGLGALGGLEGLGGGGIPDLGGSGAGGDAGLGGAGGSSDPYFECINEAGNDPEALNECASEL